MNRFARTERLLGAGGLARLARARVLVCGLGAVGSYAVEGLARAGVGRLRLVDFDVIRSTNINRQLYALESTLGRAKVDVAAERVRDIHPACEVETMKRLVNRASVDEVLAGSWDAVVDAIDSLGPKVALLHAAVTRKMWVVSSMGAATRTDPGAIRVGDLSETGPCPLARLVRKRLRRLGVTGGIRCVFSREPAAADHPGFRSGNEAEDVPMAPGRIRRPLGSLSTLTGIFGLTAATETILHLARNPDGNS